MRIRPTSLTLALALALAFALAAVPASAAPGDLDPSFSGDGIAKPAKGNFPDAVAVQSDGKLVVVGGGIVLPSLETRGWAMRLLPNGAPDPAFGGGDGFVTFAFSEEYSWAHDAAIQENGRIVIVGTSEDAASGRGEIAVIRLTETGRRDRGFNGGGVYAGFGWDDVRPSAVEIQPDGKILVAGTGTRSTTLGFVLRLLSSGAADGAFSKDGRAVFDTQGADVFEDLVVTGSGRIVAGGSVRDQGVGETFAAVAFTRKGALDTDFGGDGVASYRTGGVMGGRAIALGPDGTILVAGLATSADTSQDGAVVRFTERGTIDRTFDDDGLAPIAVGKDIDETLFDLVVQPDGRVLVIGDSGRLLGMVVRLKADGARDGSFGVARGASFVQVGNEARLYGGALDNKGRLVVVGYGSKGGEVIPIAARLLTA